MRERKENNALRLRWSHDLSLMGWPMFPPPCFLKSVTWSCNKSYGTNPSPTNLSYGLVRRHPNIESTLVSTLEKINQHSNSGSESNNAMKALSRTRLCEWKTDARMDQGSEPYNPHGLWHPLHPHSLTFLDFASKNMWPENFSSAMQPNWLFLGLSEAAWNYLSK